ncbi:conserved hypothetical protein [Flavobacterium sp. 9AF]|uniref:DUF6705 family protein n=1 Tax=Flavobacterium sp. 9AF TaxID=2653142 RepID=UPI0012EFEA19|nr:DUF6705 family protein [Flavobacterium sp. 9AF]VXB31332.1 conserved hypothetical protein [Flavobacterium sp. 9AF]
MKNIFKIIILFITIAGYSQQIVPVESKYEYNSFEAPKKYYKDVNGVFNKFIGTWVWQDNASNPTKSFEITFYKHEMRDQGGISYTDFITSKFKYINNGTEVYNTYNDRFGYIFGSTIYTCYPLTSPQTTLVLENSCMELHYSEPIIDGRPLRKNPSGNLFLEYKNENNIQKLIWNVECFLDQNGNIPFRIPITMELIKQ